MKRKKKIAIIGSGIAGLASSYFLHRDIDITIFEKNNSFGGHIDTHHLKDNTGQNIPLDTGFLSFNKKNYPEFINLLNSLEVEYGESKINYAMEYKNKYSKSSSIIGLALNKFSCDSIEYKILKKDAKKFFSIDNSTLDSSITVEDIIETKEYSLLFFNEFLLPTISGMLSRSIEESKKMPLKRIYNYFQNHELLGFEEYEKILYVKGGYDRYVKKIIALPNITAYSNTAVTQVIQNDTGVTINSSRGEEKFDDVILGCEADIALKIIADPSSITKEILAPFEYRENFSLLHNDEEIMPHNKSSWATYTMHISPDNKYGCYTIWLNPMLQLETKENFFFTMNPWMNIDNNKIRKTMKYRHLKPTEQTLKNQSKLHDLNDAVGNIYFAGAYYKYFHEDAVVSAKYVAEKIKPTLVPKHFSPEVHT